MEMAKSDAPTALSNAAYALLRAVMISDELVYDKRITPAKGDFISLN